MQRVFAMNCFITFFLIIKQQKKGKQRVENERNIELQLL